MFDNDGFRYKTVGGLEAKSIYGIDRWYHISAEDMLKMTPEQLREIADVMEQALDKDDAT